MKWKVPIPVGLRKPDLSNLKEEENGGFELLVSNYDDNREETMVRSGEELELGGYEGRVYLFKS